MVYVLYFIFYYYPKQLKTNKADIKESSILRCISVYTLMDPHIRFNNTCKEIHAKTGHYRCCLTQWHAYIVTMTHVHHHNDTRTSSPLHIISMLSHNDTPTSLQVHCIQTLLHNDTPIDSCTQWWYTWIGNETKRIVILLSKDC